MRLPNHERALVPREKVVDYLLSRSHKDGRGKAEFFSRFGFTPDAWQTLAEALRLHAARHEVLKAEATPFGTRYVVEGDLETPGGRSPTVRVVWFVESGEEIPRLATAYPR